MQLTHKKWWNESVIYQIYPKSFFDSNDDGIGDIKGIIEKLDYLENLGVDLLWVSPVYQSPMKDNGYDISDYYRIDPLFGSDEDMETLIREARKRNMKLMMDLVTNHCSDQHIWFRKAIADPDCEEAGYFIFRTTEDGKVPNNWRSNFGGSAWTRLPDGRWYLHTFAKEQPDLNWENPRLRRNIFDMIDWWLCKGISGFRVDAITFIKKDTTFASRPPELGSWYPIENFQNYPGIGDFLHEMQTQVFGKHDCVTVAEAPGVPYEELDDYAGEDGHFSMIFDFNWDHMELKAGEKKNQETAIMRWRDAIFKSQDTMAKNYWAPLFLENHDQPRCPNKFLEREEINKDSITLLATLYFFLRGVPFIYQGQELGITNYPISSVDDVYDTAAHRRILDALERGETETALLDDLNETSRDHARTPLQWNDRKHAGFSRSQPWIPVHPDYPRVNAAQQEQDPDSVLTYYKQLIMLRKSADYKGILVYGDFAPCCLVHEKLIAYTRSADGKTIVVLNNMNSQPLNLILPLPWKKLLLSNQEVQQSENLVSMKPFQSIVYLSDC